MDNTTNIIIAVAVIVVALGLFVVVCFDKKKFSTKSIAFGAICLAMSFGLSYIRLFKMPQGGSVTAASLLPIMLYAYIFGPKKGLLIGFIYGGLQSLQDLFFVGILQYLLDYPVAFMMLGLVGFARYIPTLKNGYPIGFIIGIILASFFRYLCHALSGAVFFAEYAGSENVWIYTLTYNSFVLVDCVICALAGSMVFANKSARNYLLSFGNKS